MLVRTSDAHVMSLEGGVVVSLPYFQKRTIYTDELLQEYPIYKTEKIQAEKVPLLATWDVIKPDGSKVVQVMKYLPQINILDVHTGNIICYRMKNHTAFSLLKSDFLPENKEIYYDSVHADDNYIYASYWGKYLGDSYTSHASNFIHVFDWHGKQLYELITDRVFTYIWLDPVRNRLYTTDLETDEVFYLDMTELDSL